MRTLRILGALLLCLLVPAAAQAASLQAVGNFNRPIYVTSAPGNPERLFVVERAGLIKQVQNGAVTTFADLKEAVGCPASGLCEGERGLLSIALAPDFDTSGRFFVDYAQNSTGVIHVAELVAIGGTALFSTPHDLLTIPHPEKANHNGGQLQFGPEGNLFVSTGDGGGENDQLHNAQNLESLLGKVLRITPLAGGGYVVPAGNPFPSAAPPYNTIWSYGLRNPYRFSFDHGSGAIVIGDVGQKEREEVDYALAPGLGGGTDYGWNCREGLGPGPGGAFEDPECATPPATGFTDPIFDYPHKDPGNGGAFGSAIVGGYVVRDRSLGDLYGRYLYGDYANPELRSFVPGLPSASGDRGEGIDVANLVSFGEDSCGRIYTVSELGQVSRLVEPQAVPLAAAGSAPASPCGRIEPKPPLKASFAGIKALRRRVLRGGKALITAFVSPCAGRKGEPVKLYRGRFHIGTRHLDRACTARFRQKIGRPWSFRVTIAADSTFEAATSRKLKIKLAHRKRLQRHRRHR